MKILMAFLCRFQLTKKQKITAYLPGSAVTDVNNDLEFYSLDTSKAQLSLVAVSMMPTNQYDLLSYVAEPGIYLVAVYRAEGDAEAEHSLILFTSDTWDESEGDDSLWEAEAGKKLQLVNTPMRHTLDNSLDQDFTILVARTEGDYAISLFGVPEGYKYTLLVMDGNWNILQARQGNGTVLVHLAAKAYMIKVFAPDGKVDPKAEYKTLVSPPPVDMPMDKKHYNVYVPQDGSHVVEYFNPTGTEDGAIEVKVDGVSITPKIQELTFSIGRLPSSLYNWSKVYITTSPNAQIVAACPGIYRGSQTPMAKTAKNTMLIRLDAAVYNEAHSKVNADGTHDFWTNGMTTTYPNGAELIFDLDAMTVCDIFWPNWYSGSPNLCWGFGSYDSPEHLSVEYFKGAGMHESKL